MGAAVGRATSSDPSAAVTRTDARFTLEPPAASGGTRLPGESGLPTVLPRELLAGPELFGPVCCVSRHDPAGNRCGACDLQPSGVVCQALIPVLPRRNHARQNRPAHTP